MASDARSIAPARASVAALVAVLVVAAGGLLAAPAARAQAAPRLTACAGQESFGCGTLTVPLDHSGAVPGTVALRFAVERPARGRRLLIALSGGPGQGGVDFASSFAETLDPALGRYRLAVLDQRGTGRSGALSCPQVQALRPLDAFTPQAVGACANRLGGRRQFHATADSVRDIDALRAALGASKVALMGISYGTHVALQYARTFPDRVDRLVLDSVVGPDGPDAFLIDTFRNLPRVLREQCRGTRCRTSTRDPVADVAALAARLRQGPLRGSAFDDSGRRRATLYRDPTELAFLLVSGDLNPFLQAALPAAMSAARRGDRSLLMRLRRIAQGRPLTLRQLSFGLNVTTGCLDAPLPYSFTAPPEERAAAAQAALAAIDPAQYAPFDGATLLGGSYVDDCMLWPADVPRLSTSAPLPDVPALLIGGRLDLRTPVENAVATAAELPRASVVALRGAGHDAIDSDLTGCVRRALVRFVAGRTVGRPCQSADNGVDPLPLPPRTLRDFRSAPSVGGLRGRALFASLDSVQDARLTGVQRVFSGMTVRGGGLHGGRFTGSDFQGRVRLRSYSYVPGLRVTGSVAVDGGSVRGRLTVRGPQGTSGFLVLDGSGGVTGRLGGRAVRFREGAAARAAAVGGVSRRVDGGVMPAIPRGLLRAAR